MAGTNTSTAADWRYEPLPSQLDFHGDLASRAKGFSGPVGSGKSYALVYEAIFNALLYNPGRMGLIGAPSYPMLRDVTQRSFFEVLEEEGIRFMFFKQENKLVFHKNGNANIVFRSMDNPESLRGTNLAWFGVDELTYCHEDSFLRLLARLRDPKANHLQSFGSWTPKGYDWVYRRFINPGTEGYKAVLALPRENRYLPGYFYDGLKTAYSSKFYRQEAEGEYLSLFSGQVYYAFDRNQNMAEVQYDPGLPLYWSLDFNVDPMCSVIAQIHDFSPNYARSRELRQLHVLEEICLPDSNIDQACAEFVRRTQKFIRPGWPVTVYVHGDPAGNWRSHAGPSDYQLIKNYFRHEPSVKLEFRIAPNHPHVKDRVNAVNSLLCNAQGARRLYMHRDCKELQGDLEQVSWKRDASENPTGDLDKSDPKRTHVSDALGYLVAEEFPLRASVGAR